jgi:hypothetical protein
MIFGAALIALGVIGYLAPEMLGQFENVSPTALIPAGLGAVMLLCGFIALIKPGSRKHAMHTAALVGVLGVAGGFMPLSRSEFNFQKASAVSGLLMVSLSALFVLLCVKSFIDARKSRA